MSIVKFTLMSAIIAAIVIPSLRDKNRNQVSTPIVTYTEEERIELDELKNIQKKKEKISESKRNKYLSVVRKERKIMDVVWTKDTQLWASVLNDGQNRNGYADYLCVLSKEYNFKYTFTILLFDAQKATREEYVQLGRHRCVSQ